ARSASVSLLLATANNDSVFVGWLAVGTAQIYLGQSPSSGNTIYGSALNQNNFTSLETIWGNYSPAGYLSYLQAPTAPVLASVTSNPTGAQATVVITPSSDNGGTSITNYRVEWSEQSNFATLAGTS